MTALTATNSSRELQKAVGVPLQDKPLQSKTTQLAIKTTKMTHKRVHRSGSRRSMTKGFQRELRSLLYPTQQTTNFSHPKSTTSLLNSFSIRPTLASTGAGSPNLSMKLPRACSNGYRVVSKHKPPGATSLPTPVTALLPILFPTGGPNPPRKWL